MPTLAMKRILCRLFGCHWQLLWRRGLLEGIDCGAGRWQMKCAWCGTWNLVPPTLPEAMGERPEGIPLSALPGSPHRRRPDRCREDR